MEKLTCTKETDILNILNSNFTDQMPRIIPILLLSGLLLSSSNSELVQTIHYIRHGAIVPKYFQFKENQFGKEQSNITNLGMLQAYLTGKEFRQRYIEDINFLSKDFNEKEVWIRSCEIPRASTTAKAFFSGLYSSPDEGEYIENTFNVSSEHLLALKNPKRRITMSDMEGFRWNETWAQEHIHINHDDNRYFFQSSRHGTCNVAGQIIGEQFATKENERMTDFYKTHLYSKLSWQINNFAGYEILPESLLDMNQVRKICDTVQLNDFHNIPRPDFDPHTMSMLKAAYYYQAYELFLRDPLVRLISTSKLFESISQFTKRIVTHPDSTPKFIAYFGHGTNIKTILAQLITEAELTLNEEYTVTPFTSVISLYINKEFNNVTNKTSYTINATFNDMPLSLKWCKDYSCPLHVFQNMLDVHTIPDLEKYCSMEVPEIYPDIDIQVHLILC